MQHESIRQRYESLIKSTDGPEDSDDPEDNDSTKSTSDWEAANEEEAERDAQFKEALEKFGSQLTNSNAEFSR